jgi:hypothetical protein
MSSIEVPAPAPDLDQIGDRELQLPGELVYEYTPRVTRIVEFGESADDILMRKTPPPTRGARFDLYLEGPVIAGRLKGSVAGVDYLNVRADGRAELHIHAAITTNDGKMVALEAGGVAIPEAETPVFQLREHVNLISSYPELSWVNTLEVWARGIVDISTGQVHIKAYAM